MFRTVPAWPKRHFETGVRDFEELFASWQNVEVFSYAYQIVLIIIVKYRRGALSI